MKLPRFLTRRDRVVLRNFASIPVVDRFPWQLSLTVM